MLGTVITTVANFAIAFLVSIDGAEVAGVFFVATAIVTILGNSSALGTMTSMVFFMPRVLGDDAPNPRSLLVLSLVPVVLLSMLASVSLIVAAPTLSELVADNRAAEVASMLRVLAMAIVPWALTLNLMGATRALGSHTPTVLVTQVVRPGLQIVVLGLLFGFGDPTPVSIAVGWGVPVVVGGVMAMAAVHRMGGFVGSGPGPVGRAEFWSYTRPRALSTTMQIALERIDVVLVSAIVGEGPAGVYGALSRFVTAGNFLVYSVAQAVSNNLRRALARAEWENARALLHKATAWLVLAAWPYFLVIGLKPEPLADLLNSEFVADAGLLAILAAGMLFSAISGPIELTLLMLGRSSVALIGVTAAIVVDIVLIVLLAPTYGLTGAAIAWAAGVVVQNVIATIFVVRTTSPLIDTGRALTAPSRRAGLAALGTVVAVVPVALMTPNTLFGLVITGLVAVPLLAAWAFRFRGALGVDELVSLG